MEINFFQIKDLEGCANLLIQAYSCALWDNNWSNESSKKYLKEFCASPRFVGFTIYENQMIIGAAFC